MKWMIVVLELCLFQITFAVKSKFQASYPSYTNFYLFLPKGILLLSLSPPPPPQSTP